MSMIASNRTLARMIDWQTPPANINAPVRASRVPRCGCQECDRIGLSHQRGKPCACGSGTMEALPASAWRWCGVCIGRSACCEACGWHGVELRRDP
jgi:hypothetical protein